MTRLQRLKLLLVYTALAFVAIMVAACGGTTKTVTVTKVPPPIVKVVSKAIPPSVTGQAPKLKCSPENLIMQCVLQNEPPAPLSNRLGAQPNLKYGIDFGWSRWSLQGLHSIGASFVAGYISRDSSKNLNVSDALMYPKHGIGVVLVWETSADRTLGGPIAAAEDEPLAKSQAADRGDKNGPIEFAIDFDAESSSQLSAVNGYFAEMHHLLGNTPDGQARDDGYGGETPISYLHSHGSVGNENWMTYAWQNGRPWLPASIAPLEQYLNGDAYDHDRAIATNYGQFAPRGSVVPSLPVNFKYLEKGKRHFRIRPFSPVWGAPYNVVASEGNTMRTWVVHGCEVPARREICKSTVFHAGLLEGRVIFVAHHSRDLKRFVHPPRWGDYHLGIRHLILNSVQKK